MTKPLQFLLASINIGTAALYPVLSFQHSVVARIAGVSCGLIAISLSRGGLFQPIIFLNNQRQTLKKEVRRLESEIPLLKRKLQDIALAKEKEFKEREQALFHKEQNLQEQLQQVASAKEAELNEREQSIIQAEKELEEQITAANEELETDKEKFLKEQENIIAQYQSKIDLLESELDELRSLLAQYEAPALPEGSSFEIILVRHCMELLLAKRVICEFKGVAVDPDGYVVARLKPQDGGQKAIEKWANHLHIEMELAEPPKFETLRGAVQIWLKPQEMVKLPAVPGGSSPNPSPNPPNLRIIKTEVIDNSPESLIVKAVPPNPGEPNKQFDERLMTFVEPSAKLPPFGAIRQIERDWVGYLYCFREPPTRNQKEIIFKVWGYKSGDSNGYRSARARLYTILSDAGIEIKKRSNQ
jgi:hypothetical protein